MVEKVSVSCPNCRVRVRMPVSLRPGKKPRCPKCKIIIRPADVLPPGLLVPKPPAVPAVDPYAETRTRLPDGKSREADPYAETVAKMPDERPPDDADDDTPPWSPIPAKAAKAAKPAKPAKPKRPPQPEPLEETVMPLPGEFPPAPLDDTEIPSEIVRVAGSSASKAR